MLHSFSSIQNEDEDEHESKKTGAALGEDDLFLFFLYRRAEDSG